MENVLSNVLNVSTITTQKLGLKVGDKLWLFTKEMLVPVVVTWLGRESFNLQLPGYVQGFQYVDFLIERRAGYLLKKYPKTSKRVLKISGDDLDEQDSFYENLKEEKPNKTDEKLEDEMLFDVYLGKKPEPKPKKKTRKKKSDKVAYITVTDVIEGQLKITYRNYEGRQFNRRVFEFNGKKYEIFTNGSNKRVYKELKK